MRACAIRHAKNISRLGIDASEFIEIYGGIDREDLFLAEIGISDHAERQSSYRIGSNGGDIDHCCKQKPARLDQYSGDQCLFDDAERSFIIFERAYSGIFENALQYGKEDKESQREVSEVFHHIPEFPQRDIQME